MRGNLFCFFHTHVSLLVSLLAISFLPAAAAAVNTGDWKLYHDVKHGLSFKYSPRLTDVKSTTDGIISVTPKENRDQWEEISGMSIESVPFDTGIYVVIDAAYESKLFYRSKTGEWLLDDKPACKKIIPLGADGVPSYSAYEKRTLKFAVILKDRIILISQRPEIDPIPAPSAYDFFNTMVDTITFDNPGLVVKAHCAR